MSQLQKSGIRLAFNSGFQGDKLPIAIQVIVGRNTYINLWIENADKVIEKFLKKIFEKPIDKTAGMVYN